MDVWASSKAGTEVEEFFGTGGWTCFACLPGLEWSGKSSAIFVFGQDFNGRR